jgi:hypothetical protein
MHKDETGICEECAADRGFSVNNPTDNSRPKIRGKHMVIQKSPEQKAVEQRQKSRGIRVRY